MIAGHITIQFNDTYKLLVCREDNIRTYNSIGKVDPYSQVKHRLLSRSQSLGRQLTGDTNQQ